tara:strand:+ start:2664 stop:2873 length:210 start_codon:yes stop_codon:yes gene_type:complete
MNVHDYMRRLGDLLAVTENIIKERDEARREACERTAENISLLGSNAPLSTLRVEHAARRGWDCYKEETS